MKRMLKFILILASLLILGCSSSKDVKITSISGVQKVIQFYSLDETNHPLMLVKISGGSYSNKTFFPKEEIEIVTGEKYSITWTCKDSTTGNYDTFVRANEEFNFNGIQVTIYVGNSSGLFIYQQ